MYEINIFSEIILGQNYKEFYSFAKKFREEKDIEKQMDRLIMLKELEDDVLLLAIAKTEAIESHYDHSKYLAAYVALMATYLLAFSRVVHPMIAFLLTAGILAGILYGSVLEKKKRVEAVFLKSLLTQIKNERNKK
ncbi:hypothetical protein [Fictibacillus phosphorivorans]|uniref:Uncharacterized protein n=1 Tax=Fictibacillus phosphorivorans TaxID=1221500 RepID=A0A168W047_9BACL|nr:hypothetical protein [Fictibacillus phosphorivorans]ANC77195.1 hypothetical protein ABE65_010425 [Fictibacillus phosphorivorans]